MLATIPHLRLQPLGQLYPQQLSNLLSAWLPQQQNQHHMQHCQRPAALTPPAAAAAVALTPQH
jgi:hypothetical protein